MKRLSRPAADLLRQANSTYNHSVDLSFADHSVTISGNLVPAVRSY
jgi:hypothetical protein